MATVKVTISRKITEDVDRSYVLLSKLDAGRRRAVSEVLLPFDDDEDEQDMTLDLVEGAAYYVKLDVIGPKGGKGELGAKKGEAPIIPNRKCTIGKSGIAHCSDEFAA